MGIDGHSVILDIDRRYGTGLQIPHSPSARRVADIRTDNLSYWFVPAFTGPILSIRGDERSVIYHAYSDRPSIIHPD